MLCCYSIQITEIGVISNAMSSAPENKGSKPAAEDDDGGRPFLLPPGARLSVVFIEKQIIFLIVMPQSSKAEGVT